MRCHWLGSDGLLRHHVRLDNSPRGGRSRDFKREMQNLPRLLGQGPGFDDLRRVQGNQIALFTFNPTNHAHSRMADAMLVQVIRAVLSSASQLKTAPGFSTASHRGESAVPSPRRQAFMPVCPSLPSGFARRPAWARPFHRAISPS